MNLIDAVSRLVGRADLIAVRPPNHVLMVTDRNGLKDVSNGVPRQWVATVSAIVGDNWEVMEVAKFAAKLKAEAGQGG